MKPWLFDILACPIDKNYPLKLYIFSFETKINNFQSFLDIYEKRDEELIKKEGIIEIDKEPEDIYLKDDVIIEKNPIKTYIDLIMASINEFDHFYDRTSNKISKTCFNIIKNEIRNKIIEFSKNLPSIQIETILPELYFVNKIKLEIEIESGLLFCQQCKRWYPIIETIPQMLPDEYRNEQEETEFLRTNKNLLDEEFINQDLKPFKI